MTKEQCKPLMVKDLGKLYPTPNSKVKKYYGMFACVRCEVPYKAQVSDVNNGRSHRCKDCRVEVRRKDVRNIDHKLYSTWQNMNVRCNSVKSPHYQGYGSRGIKVSEEFKDFNVWVEYVESLKDAYKSTYTLDRKNNDGNYERGNMRWASKSVQAANRNHKVIGISKHVGVSYCNTTLRWRAYIKVDTKFINIGYFLKEEEAILARKNFVLEGNLMEKGYKC